MAQINLFASELTPVMRDFLSTYQNGAMQPVGAIRVLEEHPHPHIDLMMDSVERGHIFVEVSPPLNYGDIHWLYRTIIAGEQEYTRGVVTRYCVRRCFKNKADVLKNKNVVPPTEEEWAVIHAFRRALEAPSLALRHLNATHRENGMVQLHKYPNVLVIEYDHIDNLPKRRHTARQ